MVAPPSLPEALLLARVLWERQRLLWHDRWSRRRLLAHQTRGLRALRAFACARSPFYRRSHAGLEQAPLNELPVLTKATLMEHFDELVTDPAVRLAALEQHVATLQGDDRFLGRYWVNATSGSSGRRGIFLFDQAEWGAFLASWARGHDWTGYPVLPWRRLRIAVVASTVPWHMSARVGATLGSRWVATLRLDAGQPVRHLVAALNAFQPEIAVAYPSVAGVLAAEQRAGRLRIAPALIFTGAEVLTERTRQVIEATWGKRLFDQYAATEAGGIAAECNRHTGLHLFEDRLIVEVVDRDYRPVPAGTFGDVLLVTVLGSQTLPLIRYVLDDSVRLAARPCPCGRPFTLVESVQGKAQEVLTFPGVTGNPVLVNPVVFHRVMDLVLAEGWQVVQEPDLLRVRVVGLRDETARTTVERAMREALVAQEVRVPPIVVEVVSAIARGATGKVLLITSTSDARSGEPAS